MANEKAPSAGGQKTPLVNHPDKVYFKLAALTGEMFPSWEVDALRDMVRGILVMARPEAVELGVMDSACSWIPGAGVIQLHFDGKGGVMLDPNSDFTPPIRELVKALRLVLGALFTVGRPAEVVE